MKITPVKNPISFKYKSVLKSEWLKGNMPTVTKGIYGGELKPYNVTLEHIKPHSKGGKTELNNLALAIDINNWGRGDKPLKTFFSRIIFDQYCDQFKGIKLPDFDGDEYVKSIYKTVEEELSK
ncbi:MAG: HNH endonuclease [Clostridia bacterium]|nr:HNH endonuclease [Clostridia bacterium]